MENSKRGFDQQGAALLGTILIVTMLMVLGIGSLVVATQEIRSADSVRKAISARYLAESGIALIQRWFHDSDFRITHPAKHRLTKQYRLPGYGPSFFSAQGTSQFTGTPQQPDLILQASNPVDQILLNDVKTGWLRGLARDGSIVNLRMYQPIRKGLLSSVMIEAERKGIGRTVTVQLGASRIPPISMGAMIHQNSGVPSGPGSIAPLPIEVHWGDLKVKNDVHIGSPVFIPTKTILGTIDGRSYRQMSSPEDRWFDLIAGGNILVTSSAGSNVSLGLNMYENQDPVPGVHPDAWDYARMKHVALQEGHYYVLGSDGLLYDSSASSSGVGKDPNLVLGSQTVGDHRGLIFIDTLDQQPPNPTNLGQLTLTSEYIEGIVIINAHVHWHPKGRGEALNVWSPPDPITQAQVAVPLSRIHLQGVLSVAGDLTFKSNPRVFGAVIVGGGVRTIASSGTAIEIWYDHDFAQGHFRGVPLVFLAPGTWHEWY